MTHVPTAAMMQGLIENAIADKGDPGEFSAGAWMLRALHLWDLQIVPIPVIEKISPITLGSAMFMAQHDGMTPDSEFRVGRAADQAKTLIEMLNAEGWTITRRK